MQTGVQGRVLGPEEGERGVDPANPKCPRLLWLLRTLEKGLACNAQKEQKREREGSFQRCLLRSRNRIWEESERTPFSVPTRERNHCRRNAFKAQFSLIPKSHSTWTPGLPFLFCRGSGDDSGKSPCHPSQGLGVDSEGSSVGRAQTPSRLPPEHSLFISFSAFLHSV